MFLNSKTRSFVMILLVLFGTCCNAFPSKTASEENDEVLPFGKGEEVSLEHSQAEEASKSAAGFKLSLLPEPSKTAESVNLEKEGIPSKVLSVYDQSQQKIAEISDPIPILDTISEHEKYGNNGDMFEGISRSIVNGYEAFSNFINKVIEKPKEVARKITKSFTDQLNILGGKLVGL